jgi:hypothetical protein
MDEQTRTRVEAAVVRRLFEHLRAHPEAQNIDLMVLADFCRNCLAKWYVTAAAAEGVDLSYDGAREVVYGMPYAEWKAKHQLPATPEQLAAYEARQARKNE